LYKKGGFYETTDLSNKFHLDVERRMKKFSEYAVDGGAYTYMNGGTVEVGNIDLDNLNAKPSAPSSTIAKQWEDPAYRGWYMLKYNDYVLERVMGSPSNLVDNFDAWATNNTITQKEITDMAPYEHDVTLATLTKLDEAIKKKMEDVMYALDGEFPNTLNTTAVNDLIGDPSQIVFVTNPLDIMNAPFFSSLSSIVAGTKKFKIRSESDSIALLKGRKAQDKAINKFVKENFLKKIMDENKVYFYTTQSTFDDIKAWIKKTF